MFNPILVSANVEKWKTYAFANLSVTTWQEQPLDTSIRDMVPNPVAPPAEMEYYKVKLIKGVQDNVAAQLISKRLRALIGREPI